MAVAKTSPRSPSEPTLVANVRPRELAPNDEDRSLRACDLSARERLRGLERPIAEIDDDLLVAARLVEDKGALDQLSRARGQIRLRQDRGAPVVDVDRGEVHRLGRAVDQLQRVAAAIAPLRLPARGLAVRLRMHLQRGARALPALVVVRARPQQ